LVRHCIKFLVDRWNIGWFAVVKVLNMKCESCKGTGITPYSVMKASCLICNGSGKLPADSKPLFNDYVSYEDEDFNVLNSKESILYKAVVEGHLCSGSKSLGSLGNKFTLMVGGKSGIGVNKYVVCDSCGNIQDITDYGEW